MNVYVLMGNIGDSTQIFKELVEIDENLRDVQSYSRMWMDAPTEHETTLQGAVNDIANQIEYNQQRGYDTLLITGNSLFSVYALRVAIVQGKIDVSKTPVYMFELWVTESGKERLLKTVSRNGRIPVDSDGWYSEFKSLSWLDEALDDLILGG